MEHLSDELLYASAFDQATLAAPEAEHLSSCDACRQRLEQLQKLATTLRIARSSAPPPAIVAQAHSFFQHIQQQPSWLERMVQRLQAQLVWDSRNQLAAQGLRRTVTDGYHLLYSTERIEVELSVQPTPAGLDLEGELLPAEDDLGLVPALLVLQPADGAGASYETESDADGHFRLSGLPHGRYELLITPLAGALLAIDGLELA